MEDVSRLYTNTILFYIRDLNIYRFLISILEPIRLDLILWQIPKDDYIFSSEYKRINLEIHLE